MINYVGKIAELHRPILGDKYFHLIVRQSDLAVYTLRDYNWFADKSGNLKNIIDLNNYPIPEQRESLKAMLLGDDRDAQKYAYELIKQYKECLL